MGKQVFLELTTEDNLRKLNIDPRLVDSFKRVMTEIQHYFDSHGYSDKIDFESIVNNYLLPKETVDRETIRHSAEFIKKINDYRENLKKLQTIMSTELKPIDENQYLDDFIRRNYKIGLTIEVDTKETIVAALGVYLEDINTIKFKEDPKEFSPEELDSILCHEFIHFLTMCGENEIGTISDEMQVSMFEPLTEMLSTEILNGGYQKAYFEYCEVMKYINRLAGVKDYSSFLSRKLDERYKTYSIVLEPMQDAFDRARFTDKRLHGEMLEDDKRNLFVLATTTLMWNDYGNVSDLIDALMNIYYMRGVVSQEQIEEMQEIITERYLSENNISNDQVKNKIMHLLEVKNQKRLIGDKKYSPISIEGKKYLIDSEGNIYYFDNTIINKLSDFSMPHEVIDGTLDIYTESELYSYDLSAIDFETLGNNLASQQETLEIEINTLMGGVSVNRPYIKPDTLSTVVARDTGDEAEVMEQMQVQPKLRKPYIKQETMSMLQGKIKSFELDTKKKKLLAQKEMFQQMMANQQAVTDAEEYEEQDMGMSM